MLVKRSSESNLSITFSHHVLPYELTVRYDLTVPYDGFDMIDDHIPVQEAGLAFTLYVSSQLGLMLLGSWRVFWRSMRSIYQRFEASNHRHSEFVSRE